MASLSSGRPVTVRPASRELSPRARPGARPPSESFEQLMDRHRGFLKAALRECRNAEEKRAVRFERAQTASERTQLEKRFEMERALDQQRLQRLTTDFDLLQKAIDKGEISPALVKERQKASQKPVLPKLDVTHNRFSGCETYSDVVKHESAIRMFDKIDRAAQRKFQPKFDPFPVQKNLQLLEQKRDILKQLINVQTKEIRAIAGGGGVGAGRVGQPPPPGRPQWDAVSTASGFSTKSSASWASFATGRHNVPTPAVRSNVPRLALK